MAIWNDSRSSSIGRVGRGTPTGFLWIHALLIAVSGYLRRYYPAQFLAGLLNSQPMGFYSPALLISDAERHNVAVLPPDKAFAEAVGDALVVREGAEHASV